PIDPQFGLQPTQLVIEEFDRAMKEIKKDPDKLAVWRPILEQIHPTFISTCESAIEWSREIGKRTLKDGMFKGQKNAAARARKIVDGLTDPKKNKNHGKHLHREDCARMGLKIVEIEPHPDIQDALLSAHHAFMISLMNSGIVKIVENQKGVAYVNYADVPI
ncbi:MAG: S49 family peptidase, partial [Rhodobacteraceae bacterium]|nr:S49 family peptidase [Paracoccaceae bacterium]